MKQTLEIKDITVDYTIERRRVRYARMQIKGGRLYIVTPLHFTGTEEFIDRCRGWIYKKIKDTARAMEESKKMVLAEIPVKEFIEYSTARADQYALKLGVKYERLRFRELKSKWGSCSGRGRISLNSLLRFMPAKFADFIIFHELVHIKIRRHNRVFYAEIIKEFPDMKEIDSALKTYWMALKLKD